MSPYYTTVFADIETANGARVAKWNWAAFLFGAIWYLAKGMIAKGLLMFLIAAVTFGFATPLIWLYCGFYGNYDCYISQKK